MQFNDHILIAKYLLKNEAIKISNLKQKFFVLGSIQPDINPFSYFKGSLSNKILHGHNYENSYKYIEKKLIFLQKKEKLKTKDYYHLGKVIHYIVDDFTYPHNSEFIENILGHCRYERELHQVFESCINNNYTKDNYVGKKEIMNYIVKKHDDYLKEKPAFLIDCKYIIMVCKSVISTFETENHHFELELEVA